MKTVILSVLCAIAALGVSIWLSVEHQAKLRLEEENQSLRQQVDQAADLLAENERLSNQVAQARQSQSLSEDQMRELLRLRSEVTALRQQAHAPAGLANETRPVPAKAEPAAPAMEYWPRGSWSFAGYASPTAALQSSLWAASKGDLRTLSRSLTGDAQKTAQEILANKAESEIQAAVISALAAYKAVRIVNRQVKDEESVVLTTETEEEDGPHIRKAMMKKVGADWKLYGYVP